MDSTESHWVFQDKDDSEIEDDYDEDDPSQRTANTAKENCSSSLNSVLRRCDNRMFFARQGSVCQANFMGQATIEENCSSEQATIKENCNSNLNSVIQRLLQKRSIQLSLICLSNPLVIRDLIMILKHHYSDEITSILLILTFGLNCMEHHLIGMLTLLVV
ncbi:hypothetical protein CMV_029324 [Castanea mollissima]|uniref:Uncharacterized protein n=1 Tax=Castanea mollissima TaxID=60419 RepID=A0A8J4Q3B7_9ROSI|nr:hypothetical protein CMV_029324 [Castanea mollissima]